MILRMQLVLFFSSHYADPYQRLVKTTPKPRATKKSKGELVGPLALPLLAADDVASGALDVVVVDIVDWQ